MDLTSPNHLKWTHLVTFFPQLAPFETWGTVEGICKTCLQLRKEILRGSKRLDLFGKKSWLNLTISWDPIYSYIIMIFQSSLSNLILMAHDSPLHLLHRSAKWKGSSKMAAWIAGIPIPWHPCNTPRGSPYRLRAPLKFFKTTGASPCHVLGWVALVHTISYHTPRKRLF